MWTYVPLLAFSLGGILCAQDYPKAEISNGLIRAEILLPDPQRGSYHGTRFDWSGIVSSLQFAGHEYFGNWHDARDPKIHDAVTGPAEEFLTGNESALGYDEAKPGGTFVRIGVGVIRKPDEKAYRRFATYDIQDTGKWTVRRRKDSIEFVHQLSSDDGYAYIYRKTLRLTRGKPELEIDHVLKNTGRKTIDTAQYNHNFIVIDQQVVGPDVSVQFAFSPKPESGLRNGGEIRGRELTYLQELEKGQSAASGMTGFSEDAKDYDFRVENRKAGAGVRITGDRPLSKMYYWSVRTVACPEPYIHLRIEPGSESKWKLRYEFYTLPASTGKK
jgi:hypothetical protein